MQRCCGSACAESCRVVYERREAHVATVAAACERDTAGIRSGTVTAVVPRSLTPHRDSCAIEVLSRINPIQQGPDISHRVLRITVRVTIRVKVGLGLGWIRGREGSSRFSASSRVTKTLPYPFDPRTFGSITQIPISSTRY